MPVKKASANKRKGVAIAAATKPPTISSLHMDHHMEPTPGDKFIKNIFVTLFAILVVYVTVFMATEIRNNLQEFGYIGQADKNERIVYIEAQGKVTAKPDIAMTTMGVINEGETVADAQKENTESVNNLISRLKSMGISENDIQTSNYNIYPSYNYNDGDRELNGYEVSQSVSIKIRDLEKANQVIALAGEVGANNVSGLQFTIDDPEVYEAEARQKALENAAEKVQSLRDSLGVGFVSIVSYSEYQGGNGQPIPLYARAESYDVGYGGGAPSIESGSMDVIMNVNIGFEIR